MLYQRCGISSVIRLLWLPLGLLAPWLSLNVVAAVPSDEWMEQQLIRQQEGQRALEARLKPEQKDVRLSPVVHTKYTLAFPKEAVCFPIARVKVLGTESLPKWLDLTFWTAQAEGRCLGSDGVNLLMVTLQNRLIELGYITTRVLAPEQDLTLQTLNLVIVPGQVRAVRRSDDSEGFVYLGTTVPAKAGRLLNLRDIEQGLENLQRVPTAKADIQLTPGDEPGETDVVISWQQPRWWRLGLSFDDSGTKETGRYQGNATLYLDNPLRLGDLFYFSAGSDLERRRSKGTRNYTTQYSLPFNDWQLSLTASNNHYNQVVAGYYEDMVYSGRSKNVSARLSRTVHRNATQKTTLYYEVMKRTSRNYIDDAEIDVQRRDTAAWKVGAQHRHYVGNITLDTGIAYQKGTRWFGAQPAIEESNDEGTALSKIITMSASADVPFRWLNENFTYSVSYQRQLAQNTLTAQDRFSIGGRWTVRGYDGELSLSAENGWFIRNDLTWMTPIDYQQLYLGLDYGEVSGKNSELLIGKHLAGTVLGLKGYIPVLSLNYDVFIGKALSKPTGFKTSSAVLGFNVNWSY